MTWQVLAVGLFMAWLSLGVAIGAALSPIVHRISGTEALQVQSLYHSGVTIAQAVGSERPSVRVAETSR